MINFYSTTICLFFVTAYGSNVNAALTFTLEQAGSDVVLTAEGNLDLTGASFITNGSGLAVIDSPDEFTVGTGS